MFFGRKKEDLVASRIENGELDQEYWAIVKRQFRKNRLAVWSLRLLAVLIFVAVFGDFIANEKPLYCRIDGKSYFPVIKQYAVDLGLDSWEARFVRGDWHEFDYDYVFFPPIPYSYHTLKLADSYANPLKKQDLASGRFHHLLGADHLGRDVAAGMINGTRTAMLVGLVSMSIAAIIGIFLGALAGYFGDKRLRMSRVRLVLNLLGGSAAVFYAFIARSYAYTEGSFGLEIIKSLGLILLILGPANLLASFLEKWSVPAKKIALPVDILVMRLIEIMNSIPALLLILSIVALIEKQSIFYVMIIIGLIRWTTVARFVRAELLRIRNLEYIEAAQALGFANRRIILRHALPNALTPVLITIAFGIAGAILIEAFLSFLGVGVPAEQVTWGSLLNIARGKPNAWWLAIFPGLAIFMTVTIFNLLGEGLTDALDPRLKR